MFQLILQFLYVALLGSIHGDVEGGRKVIMVGCYREKLLYKTAVLLHFYVTVADTSLISWNDYVLDDDWNYG